MDTLTSLRVFLSVADLRSFTAAAERLDLSPAMASKHLQHLEQRVGSRLLNRTSRNVSLTESGALYRETVRALIEGLDDVEARIAQTTVTPRGTLKVSLPIWMANGAFARLLAAYRERFPEVQLDIDVSGRIVNLVEEGFDLALRVTPKPEEGLILKKLQNVLFVLVAAPAFLKRNGRPAAISDLNDSPLLAYSPVAGDGRVTLGNADKSTPVQFRTVLKSPNETLLLLAAREGMGFTVMPRWLVNDDLAAGRLERVLAEDVAVTVPFFAVYPNRGYMPAKTRSFLDFIAAELAKLEFT
ncbi:MAG: LysR family transcriptional regulator [Rhizobium sp.]|nr:LysR family transcriptional regulator [Rhizobium sp.]MCZ8351148.1 LysR family transcriptional regulator [Rhizobium sp.]